MIDNSPGWSDRRARHWTSAFLANMIVPFPIAVVITHNHGAGWFGVLAAAAAMSASGVAVSGWFPRLGGVLIRGARVLAFSQLFPVLQVVSLTVAIVTWFDVVGLRLHTASPGTEVVFFAVALTAAIPLLSVAFVVGGGHHLVLVTDVPEAESESPPDE